MGEFCSSDCGCPNPRCARPRVEDRRTIEAILWRIDNGAKWRSIPAEFGNWHHAYLRFRRWAVRGVTAQCFNYGHAIGHAAAISALENMAPRAIRGGDLRHLLNKDGARLD